MAKKTTKYRRNKDTERDAAAFIVATLSAPYEKAVRRYDPHVTRDDIYREIWVALENSWGWINMYAQGLYRDGPGWKELKPE